MRFSHLIGTLDVIRTWRPTVLLAWAQEWQKHDSELAQMLENQADGMARILKHINMKRFEGR